MDVTVELQVVGIDGVSFVDSLPLKAEVFQQSPGPRSIIDAPF